MVLFFNLGRTEIAQIILKSTFSSVNLKILLKFSFQLEVVQNCLFMLDMTLETRDREDLIIS